MTAPKLSEPENWPLPNDRCRPTPQLLNVLAEAYGTSIHNLIDLDDREHLTPVDLLLISRIDRIEPDDSRDLPAPRAVPSSPGLLQPGSVAASAEISADLGIPLPISPGWPVTIETVWPAAAAESLPVPRTVEQILRGASEESANALHASEAGGDTYGGIEYGGIVFPATATFGEVMRADTAPQHIRL